MKRSRWMNLRMHSAGFRRGYSGARPDVVALLPPHARAILDVGCGSGLTADLVREKLPGAWIVGVELSSELAGEARKHVDALVEGSLGDASVSAQLDEYGPFDAIICADVLEHLAEPGVELAGLTNRVLPGGCLITSIPNVRHVSTFVSLGLMGTWPARDRGIHDRTHLRFFARGDIVKMARSAGLALQAERRNLRLLEASAWSMYPAKLLDLWPFRPFLTFQYLHRWIRLDDVA